MTSSPPSTPGRTAWLMVLLLVPVALLNYMDRQMLAAMKTSMMTDLPDIGNKANWGLVLGTFKWVYALLSPVGGALADRLEKRYVICGSLFAWSAVTWWTGHTDNFQQLLAARALMGISEAFYMPAALALITEFHLGATRSRAIGFHQMGIYAGTILGGFAGYAADSPDIGWRGAFGFSGLAGVLYALPLFWLLRKNPPAGSGPEPRLSFAASTATLFSNRNFLLLVACFTLPALAGWVVRDWMPDILKERFHLGQGKAGVSAVLYVQLACLAGVGIGGWLADRWMLLTPRGRILTSACGMLLFLPALFGVGNATTLAMAIAFLILFGLGWGFFDCNNMPILCQIVPPRLRATGYGFMNLVSISCGGFADWGFGVLRDRHVPLNLIFGAFAALALLSALLVLRIRPQPTNNHPAPS